MRVRRVGIVALVALGLSIAPNLEARAASAAAVEGPIVVDRGPSPDGFYTADTVTFPRLVATGHLEYGTSTLDGAFALHSVQYEYLEFVYCGSFDALTICHPLTGYPLVAHAPPAPDTASIPGPIRVAVLGLGGETDAGTCGGGGSHATARNLSSITLVLECTLQFSPSSPAASTTVTIELAEVRALYVAGTLTTS